MFWYPGTDDTVVAPTVPCTRPMSVFWDVENCMVPKNTKADLVVERIYNALILNPDVDSIAIKAYGVTLKTKEALKKTGVTVIDIPKRGKDSADKLILVDMLLFALDSPRPAFFLLISGDSDFGPAVKGLVKRGHTVVVAIPSQAAASRSLISSASHVWDWPSLAQGRGVIIPSIVPTDLEAVKANLVQLFQSEGGHINLQYIASMYHKRFGKQLKAAEYGVRKLIDLFIELGSPFCVMGKGMVFLDKQSAFEEQDPEDHFGLKYYSRKYCKLHPIMLS